MVVRKILVTKYRCETHSDSSERNKRNGLYWVISFARCNRSAKKMTYKTSLFNQSRSATLNGKVAGTPWKASPKCNTKRESGRDTAESLGIPPRVRKPWQSAGTLGKESEGSLTFWALFNRCRKRTRRDAEERIRRFSDVLGII